MPEKHQFKHQLR